MPIKVKRRSPSPVMVTSPSEKLSNGMKKPQTNKQTNIQNLTKPPPQDLENKGLCQALAHLCRGGETCAK